MFVFGSILEQLTFHVAVNERLRPPAKGAQFSRFFSVDVFLSI